MVLVVSFVGYGFLEIVPQCEEWGGICIHSDD
jgi:hypothetical protein